MLVLFILKWWLQAGHTLAYLHAVNIALLSDLDSEFLYLSHNGEMYGTTAAKTHGGKDIQECEDRKITISNNNKYIIQQCEIRIENT